MVNIRRNWKVVVIALFFAAIALACGEGPSQPPTQPVPTPNTNQVLATAQVRLDQIKATADAQYK